MSDEKKNHRDQGHNQREQAAKREESGGLYQGGSRTKDSDPDNDGGSGSGQRDGDQGGQQMGRDEAQGDSNQSREGS